MLFLKHKQARRALHGGRLEEALALLPALRDHRDGQDLADRLARAYVKRAERHLAEGRLPEAAQDAAHARGIVGTLPEVARLEQAVRQARAGQERVARMAGQVQQAARDRCAAGQLTLAGRLLEEGRLTESRAFWLVRDLEAKRDEFEKTHAAAEAALAAGHLSAAVQAVLRLSTLRASAAQVASLKQTVSAELKPAAEAAFAAGRLDEAGEHAAALEALGTPHAGVRQAVRDATEAGRRFAAGEYHAAAAVLRRAAAAVDARWANQAAEKLTQLAALHADVLASPLGSLAEMSAEVPTVVSPRIGIDAASPVARASGPCRGEASPNHGPDAHATALPGVAHALTSRRFLLRVDGAGSYLVCRGDSVRLGVNCDVPVLGDAPPVTLERDEEDYFLRCPAGVLVDGKPGDGRLLKDGDRIELASRCRLTFRRPTPASATAVLELGTARVGESDVRRVVLMAESVLIGGRGSHVVVPGAGRHVLAFVGGRLVMTQPKQAVVSPGQTVQTDEISFVAVER